MVLHRPSPVIDAAPEILEDRDFDFAALSLLVAGTVPDTPVVRAAVGTARSSSEPWLFNHAMRSWLFATHIADVRDVAYDPEVLLIGAVLHDLGLTKRYAAENRFEVDGANAARRLVDVFASDMEPSRRQLIWDCVALHSTGSIARHKEAEVALVNAGVAMDYAGAGLETVASERIDAILTAFPRRKMKDRFCACLCELATSKAASTYGTWVADFGNKFVDGYVAPSAVDALFAAPFEAQARRNSDPI